MKIYKQTCYNVKPQINYLYFVCNVHLYILISINKIRVLFTLKWILYILHILS